MLLLLWLITRFSCVTLMLCCVVLCCVVQLCCAVVLFLLGIEARCDTQRFQGDVLLDENLLEIMFGSPFTVTYVFVCLFMVMLLFARGFCWLVVLSGV